MDKKRKIFACLLIVLALLANQWFLGFLLSTDGKIESLANKLIIVFSELGLIFLGCVIYLKPNKKQTLLLIFSLVIFFSFLEFLMGVWIYHIADRPNYIRYALYTDLDESDLIHKRHHYMNYKLTESYRKGLTFHNSLGFRNEEFPRKKPKDEYRIVFIGGSTTYSYTIEDNKTVFTKLIQDELNKGLEKIKYRIINSGVNSYDSYDSFVNLQFRVLDIDPDMIVIYHAVNDVHSRLVHPNLYKADNSAKRKAWQNPDIDFIDRFHIARVIRRTLYIKDQVDIDAFIARGRSLGGYSEHTVLDKNPPIFFERNLNSILAIAQKNQIETLLVSFACTTEIPYRYINHDFYQRGVKEHNDIIKKLAKENKTNFFDFANRMSRDKKYWVDGVHVNEAGSRLKAELYVDYLKLIILNK